MKPRALANLSLDPAQAAIVFTRRLTALRRRTRFISRRETGAYADQLRDLLTTLDAVTDPAKGVRLTAAFFRADAAIFAACDDSNGSIGDVFRYDARDHFAVFASRCSDQTWLRGVVFKLLGADDYGVRDAVASIASRFLATTELEALAADCWHAAEAALGTTRDTDPVWTRRRWLGLVEVLAIQLHQPLLFERARRASWPDLGTAACTDIARAWLAAGDHATALGWLDRITVNERFMQEQRDLIRLEIYRATGDQPHLTELVWRRFRAQRDLVTLAALLDVIGADHRDVVIAESVAAIMARGAFDLRDALFLQHCGRGDDAARYLVAHHASLNGRDWSALRPLAQDLLAAGYPLAATVCVRALLDAILASAYQPAYGHAAAYLRTLDAMAARIDAWNGIISHDAYVGALREGHGRKSSFWRQYETVS